LSFTVMEMGTEETSAGLYGLENPKLPGSCLIAPAFTVMTTSAPLSARVTPRFSSAGTVVTAARLLSVLI
jgi:hypothetical protein